VILPENWENRMTKKAKIIAAVEAAGSIVAAEPLPASVDVKNPSIAFSVARLVVEVFAIRKICCS
jgi:hypothetical protein